MALSVGFIRFVSSTNATQATGFLTFPPVGLPPTEHASLSLDALWPKYSKTLKVRGLLRWSLRPNITSVARLLAFVTGLVNQELLLKNEYLLAENRILKARLQPGFRLPRPARPALHDIYQRHVRHLLH